MSATNYLSIIAILISMVSLGIAIRTAHFGHAAKSSELRAAVLVKFAEASARLAHVSELRSYMLARAEITNNLDWFKRANKIKSEQIHERTHEAYRKLAAMPANQGLRIHRELFHEACELNELTVAYERQVQELHAAQFNDGENQA